MKFILMSVGTRGDMEPFLAIGQGLKTRGHRVICSFPEQFGYLAEEAGLGFASLGSGFLEMLDSDLGQAAMGGGGSVISTLVANVRLASRQTEINRELVATQHDVVERERPDRILYNGKAMYPVLWEMENRGRTVLISPVPYLHHVKGHAHLAFHRNFGSLLNRLTYRLADFGQAVAARTSARWLGRSPTPTLRGLGQVLADRRVVYTISPALFPRSEYWDSNVQVLGHHECTGPRPWRPDEALQTFLDRHSNDRILFVTFGSMTNPAPEQRTQTLLDVLLRCRIPTIINTASGGLVRPDGLASELLHFVSEIPYEHILPRVHAVVHHGGSGTTHMALRAGCAMMVVPHIIDQFAWSRIVESLGVGPQGLLIKDFTAERLEPRILDLCGTSQYRRNAEDIAATMATEDLEEPLYLTLLH